ncbi:hypothetical protein [Nakamurella endophytica]|uniref:Uncharacterized protein n=1 Tax=Nakamurella endophytica TaxID=1748367 RepID=A0A917SLJ1_9ACTN|nr:hypothetical protein [Nakamurella endophytica]GGL87093.1 hypothetical protein GCM10011594_03340 [Nakamurella endophytica]
MNGLTAALAAVRGSVSAVPDAVGRVLAGNSPADVDPTTGKGPEWGKAAPIGLLIIVLMCVVCYFLARSMSKNLKRVPESFDTPADAGDPAGAGSPADAAATAGAATGKGAGAARPAAGAAGRPGAAKSGRSDPPSARSGRKR